MAELTDEERAREDAFMKGLPRFNIAAFLLPPIWGAANGFWVTILYYPIWLFMDNLLYATYTQPSPLSITLAILASLLLLALTIVFAVVSQPLAAHRAEDRGMSRAQYLHRQRIWAIGSAIGAALLLGLATYYNLGVRPYV